MSTYHALCFDASLAIRKLITFSERKSRWSVSKGTSVIAMHGTATMKSLRQTRMVSWFVDLQAPVWKPNRRCCDVMMTHTYLFSSSRRLWKRSLSARDSCDEHVPQAVLWCVSCDWKVSHFLLRRSREDDVFQHPNAWKNARVLWWFLRLQVLA